MNTKVIITAEDRTSEGFASAQASLTKFAATVGAVSSVVNKLIETLGETAKHTVELYKEQIKLADSLDEMSVRMGMSIKDLVAWKAAAEMNGTTVESMQAGVRMLAKHMTEHGEALRKAGIDSKDANGAFLQLADLFKGMTDPVARLDLATRIFGRGVGQQLLPVLIQGSEELRKVAEETDGYGDALTALSPEAQKFNDTLYLMGINFKQAAAEGVFPLVKKFNDELLPALREVAKEGSLLKTLWVGFGGVMKISFADPWNQTLLGAKATLQQFMADVSGMLASVTFGRVAALHRQEQQRLLEAAKATLREAAGNLSPQGSGQSDAPGPNTNAKGKGLAGALGTRGHKADPFDNLMKQIHERNAELEAEANGSEKLTSEQKFALKIMADLQGGYLKLTDAQKVKLALDLEELLKNGERVAALKKEHELFQERLKVSGKMVEQDAKVAEMIRATTEANREHIEAMQFELSIMGLSDDAKKRAQALRQIDIKLAKDLLAAEKELANRVDSDGINTDLDAAQATLRANADAAKRDVGSVLDAVEARNRDVFAGLSDAATAYFSELSNKGRQAGDALTRVFRGVEDVLTKTFETGRFEVKDFFALLRHEAAVSLAKQTAGPINQVIGGGIGALLKGILGSGSAGSAGSVGSEWDFGVDQLPGWTPAFAGGGDHRGGWRMVGERGPELEATGPARIFNADQTRGILAGGGDTASLTVNIIESPTGGGQVTQRNEGGQQIVDILVARVKGEMIRDVRQGGDFSQTLEKVIGGNRAAAL